MPQDHNALQSVIEHQYGCKSRHEESVRVRGISHGNPVWQGTVEVFTLYDCQKASERCYAWFSTDGGVMKVTTVLQIPAIDSPEQAVQVALGVHEVVRLDESNTASPDR